MREVEASWNGFAYVTSLARQSLDNIVCFTELIDNSLDAGASVVRIDLQKGSIRFWDNGSGVPDLDKLVCFGGHASHGRRGGSGIYGIGFKDAVLGLGGEQSTVQVETSHRGRLYDCKIDWKRLKDSARCMTIADAAAPDEPPRTSITVIPHRLRFPDGDRRVKFLAQLGYIYAPALKRGAVIQVTTSGRTMNVEQWKRPSLTDVVDRCIDLNGRRARVYAGIVSAGEQNEHSGLTYYRGFRVVKRASAYGCGAYSPARICGFVELDEKKSWERTKNKTDLVEADDLYEEVERILRPILEKAQAQARTIEFDGMVDELEAMLSSAILGDNAKAKRERCDGGGSVEPKNTGRRHRRAKKEQEGATFPRGKATQIKLEFRPGLGEIGKWERSNKAARILLDADHPHVIALRNSHNVQAIFTLAMTVAAIHIGDAGGQGGFVVSNEVIKRIGEFTSRPVRLDGVSVSEAAE
jgi:hypothetical protein